MLQVWRMQLSEDQESRQLIIMKSAAFRSLQLAFARLVKGLVGQLVRTWQHNVAVSLKTSCDTLLEDAESFHDYVLNEQRRMRSLHLLRLWKGLIQVELFKSIRMWHCLFLASARVTEQCNHIAAHADEAQQQLIASQKAELQIVAMRTFGGVMFRIQQVACRYATWNWQKNIRLEEYASWAQDTLKHQVSQAEAHVEQMAVGQHQVQTGAAMRLLQLALLRVMKEECAVALQCWMVMMVEDSVSTMQEQSKSELQSAAVRSLQLTMLRAVKGECAVAVQCWRVLMMEEKAVAQQSILQGQMQSAAVRSLQLSMTRLLKGMAGEAVKVWQMAYTDWSQAAKKQELALSMIGTTLLRVMKGECAVALQCWRGLMVDDSVSTLQKQMQSELRSAAVRSLQLTMLRAVKGVCAVAVQCWRSHTLAYAMELQCQTIERCLDAAWTAELQAVVL